MVSGEESGDIIHIAGGWEAVSVHGYTHACRSTPKSDLTRRLVFEGWENNPEIKLHMWAWSRRGIELLQELVISRQGQENLDFLGTCRFGLC